jgi:tetratricopeptide (TPR) repeat protein
LASRPRPSRSRREKAPDQALSPYIRGPVADGFWIIGSPVVALALLSAVWAWSGRSDLAIYAVLFGLVVTGHHLPGWFRAFGEPSIYRRYKARLWTSLVAVPALVILPTAFGLGAVALTVAAAFDLWHVAMQQHGFGRIYAAKSGDRSKTSARLDLACVLTWYATAVAWSDPWMAAIARVFRKAGLPIFGALSTGAWRGVQWALLGVSAALLAAYVVRALRLRSEGIRTPQKHLLHFAAFSVIVWTYQFPSWYRAQSVQNLFHASQYFAMVWIYGALSLGRSSEGAGRFYRRLFGSRRGLLAFAACVAAYGAGAIALSASGYRLTGVDAERTAQVIGSIGLASLLLHFYVDSFIWKVRSREVRTALAIRDETPAAVSPAPPASPAAFPTPERALRGVGHAVAYFGIPVALIALAGIRGRTVPPAAERASLVHEAELFPRSAAAHGLAGQAALAANDGTAGRSELERSVALAPSLEGPALALVKLDILERQDSLEHARAAVRANPRDPEARYSLGNAFSAARRLDEAAAEFEAAIKIRPGFAGAHENLGVVRKWQGRLHEAIPHFRRARDLDPNLEEAALNLAGALATEGQVDEALAILADDRRRHPDSRVAADLEAAIRKETGR